MLLWNQHRRQWIAACSSHNVARPAPFNFHTCFRCCNSQKLGRRTFVPNFCLFARVRLRNCNQICCISVHKFKHASMLLAGEFCFMKFADKAISDYRDCPSWDLSGCFWKWCIGSPSIVPAAITWKLFPTIPNDGLDLASPEDARAIPNRSSM